MEERWFHLFDAYLENRLTGEETAEFRELLRTSPEARGEFWEYFEQHAMIEDVLGENRGRDLALAEINAEFTEPETSRPSPLAPHFAPLASRLSLGFGIVTILAASLLIALGSWWHQQEAPTAVTKAPALAKVRSFSGDVQVVDALGKSAALSANSNISAGQFLHVGDDDSQAEVVFADGTQVVLSAGTNVQFSAPTDAHENRLYLKTGAVQIQATQPSKLPMIVTTDHARITAAETRFRIYREPEASRVELEQGKVLLARPAGEQSVEVPEGSYAIATEELTPMVPQRLPVSSCRVRHTFLRAGDVVRFSPDAMQLVTSHFSRGLKSWNTMDGSLLASVRGCGQRLDGLAFVSRDTVIGLGDSGAAMFWKVGEPQASITGLWDKQLRRGAVSPDGRWLAQGTSRGEVAIWEADAEKGSIALRHTLAVKPSRVALSTVGPHLAVSRWGGEIQLFEVNSAHEVAQYKLKPTPTPLAVSNDSRFLAAYTNTDGLHLFDRQTGCQYTLWGGGGARVGCLEFSQDGHLLLAGLGDGTVRAWSTSDGSSLLVLETGHHAVRQVTAAADLSLLATVGDGDVVKIWEYKEETR